MTPKRNRIAHYRTEAGAKRYAADLVKAWPMYSFGPCPHPRDFGFSVALRYPGKPGIAAYVRTRPKGAIGQLGFTGN